MSTFIRDLFNRSGYPGLGRQGNIAILTAFMMIPLIGGVGLAVDGARAYMLHSRMVSAVDAAALAAGRVLSTSNVEADAKMYFRTNIPQNYLGASIPDPVVTIGPNNETVSVTSSATLPTTFMKVLGISNVPVSVTNRVKRSMQGLELALVLDVTGSMWGSKLDQMKASATDLVNILFGSDVKSGNNNELLRISVVPYSATVNLGLEWKSAWLNTTPKETDYPLANGETWRGCVEARPGHDSDEEPPSAKARFTRFFYASTLSSHKDSPAMADNDWNPKDSKTITDNGLKYTNDNSRRGPNLGCGPAILPLTNVKDDIVKKIASLQGVNRGGTMANLGLQAGWFSLSPKWRHSWGPKTPDNIPLDYDDPDSTKAVVLLTDGVNEWYDWPDQPPTGDYTAYGRLFDTWLKKTTTSAATAEINMRMSTLCTAMKDRGITIYTITLDVTNETTKSLYRSCASQSSYYFNSPKVTDLASIFKEIGSQLSNLRIDQ